MTNGRIGALAALPAAGIDHSAALQAVGAADRVIVVAAGSEPFVHVPNVAVGGDSSRDGAQVAVTVDEPLLQALIRHGQAPRVPSTTLSGPVGALTAAAVAASGRPCVPMTVSAAADQTSLAATAAGLRLAAGQVDGTTSVLGQADLGDDPDFVAAVMTALEAGQVDVLSQLGPDVAAHHGAAGWAPLTLMALLAANERRAWKVTSTTDGVVVTA